MSDSSYDRLMFEEFKNMRQMRANAVVMMEKVAQTGLPVAPIRLPWITAYLVTDPDLAEDVLITNARQYGKTTRGYRVMRQFLGNGLLTSEGDFWLKQRRTAQPAFHREKIAGFGERMTRITDATLAQWKTDEPFDMHEAMMELTVKIVANTLLSTNVDDTSEVGAAVTELIAQAIYKTMRPITLPQGLPTARNRRYRKARDTLNGIVGGIITARRQNPQGDDLLGMLMEARDPETGEGMSDAQLHDEVMTMFLAGHETTANALSWGFALLSQHPEIEARVFAELQSVLGARTPTAADVHCLPYLGAVLKEVLRLYPPAWIVGRGALRDQQLGNVMLKKGTYAFVSMWTMHRSEKLWERPNELWPERWLDPAFKPHKCAYMPFLTGPRKCIGDSFALMEATLVMAMTLQRFTFDRARMPQAEPMITLRPKGALTMVARPRTADEPHQTA